MSSVSRIGDMTAGHGFHPTPADSGSGNVVVNGIPVVRVGDTCSSHTKPDSPPHVPVLSGGSGSVLVNGKPVVRIGDPTGCGDSMAGGSSNTTKGG